MITGKPRLFGDPSGHFVIRGVEISVIQKYSALKQAQ
jgi:hypothetical protein